MVHEKNAVSKSAFDYTPWPVHCREKMERIYQAERLFGEHRIRFLERFTLLQLSIISQQAEKFDYPNWFEPTAEQTAQSDKLVACQEYWRGLLNAHRQAMLPSNRDIPCRLMTLPSWVERALCTYKTM
jgi:hypothetical protein